MASTQHTTNHTHLLVQYKCQKSRLSVLPIDIVFLIPRNNSTPRLQTASQQVTSPSNTTLPAQLLHMYAFSITTFRSSILLFIPSPVLPHSRHIPRAAARFAGSLEGRSSSGKLDGSPSIGAGRARCFLRPGIVMTTTKAYSICMHG